MKYYRAKHVIAADELIENGIVAVEEGIIRGIYTKPESDWEVEDLGEGYLAPGLVDTHIHGLVGEDIMFAKPGALEVMSNALLETGVTTWLPTTLTASEADLNAAVTVVGNEANDVTGAKVGGIFLEGPFFTETFKGAQNEKYMSAPHIEDLDRWISLSGNKIKKIAIAPETEGAAAFTEQAKERGVYVALGHSNATYQEAKASVDAGASIFVHTYNGMRGLHHREPGMVGAAMHLPDVFAECICDGEHVNPVSAAILMDVRGRDETVLITDCMMAGGMPEGAYKLGEFDVTVKDGTARLQSGNLAGSILQLKNAVKNVVDWKIATPEEALRMASEVPAKSVGLEGVCGALKVGHAADFVVFDEDMNLVRTYLDGTLRYQSQN